MNPILFNTEMVRAILDGRKTATRRVVKERELIDRPPYRPGDILYVRETFKIDYLSNVLGSGRIHYKADNAYRDFTFEPERYEMMRRAQLKPGWRPSENMPREAARIFLRVTEVRVERLHEITEEQARAEGVKGWMAATDRDWDKNPNHLLAFRHAWNSTLKKSDRALYGWDANPWVWVIAFERISREEAEHD